MKGLKCLLLLPAFVLCACQSFNSLIHEPKVSFNSVDISRISLSGVELIAHVDVENPNSFSVPLQQIDWELYINSSSFIRGSLKKDQSLKSRQTVTIDFPVSFTYSGLYNSVKSLIETKEAAYNIALGITFPIPIIESKVFHLDFSGVIPLPQLPKLKPGSMKIAKIDFSGIEMAWAIGVENPNRFSVPFPKLDWDFDVNGVSVLKSSFSGPGEIAAGAASAAVISVGVSYADIFRAVSSLRNQGTAAGNLSLGMNADDAASFLPFGSASGGSSGAGEILKMPEIIPILRMPEVSFRGITRKSSGILSALTSLEFELSWEVVNNNSFSMGIGEFLYDFRVNSNSWAQGRMNNPPRVSANGSTVIPLTVSVSTLSMVRELVDIISRGTPVTYNCAGNMSFSGDFPGLDKLDFTLNLQGNTRIQ